MAKLLRPFTNIGDGNRLNHSIGINIVSALFTIVEFLLVFVVGVIVQEFGCRVLCLLDDLSLLASQRGSSAGYVTSDAVPFTGRLWLVRCSSKYW